MGVSPGVYEKEMWMGEEKGRNGDKVVKGENEKGWEGWREERERSESRSGTA